MPLIKFYSGITNDFERRCYEHKHKLVKGFTQKYNVNKLIYFRLYYPAYFPIQKFLKIFPRISSVVISPVISPR